MITFYDNNGKTADRYSMSVRTKSAVTGYTEFQWYSFSRDAGAPDGINTFLGQFEPKEIEDEQINFDELPLSVQIACLRRINPLED